MSEFLSAIEKGVVARIVTAIIEDGKGVVIGDGDGLAVINPEGKNNRERKISTEPKMILDTVGAVEGEYIRVMDMDYKYEREPLMSACVGSIYMLWGNGNDGRDCIVDYTEGAEKYVKDAQDYADNVPYYENPAEELKNLVFHSLNLLITSGVITTHKQITDHVTTVRADNADAMPVTEGEWVGILREVDISLRRFVKMK